MKIDKKYLIRRNLDRYSELEFAREMEKIYQRPFFPFKDKGIDIIGIDDGNRVYFYQLKARNFNIRKKVWGFKIDKKKMEIFPQTKNSFWIFCALRIAQDKFDFFKIPINILKKLYEERIRTTTGSREGHFIDIKQKEGKWKFTNPERLNDITDFNKYLL